MAHQISVRASGFAEMAFVGATPWHNLGNQLQRGASMEAWRTASGMDWQALSAPAQFTAPDGTLHTFGDKQVIYRSDTMAPLSVMGSGYQIVHPGDVLEFFRSATENGGWELHTAGCLDGGRKFWALARPVDGMQGEAAKGDTVRANLLLSTSLDGTLSTEARMTTVRVVCANTLGYARQGQGKRGRAVKVSHRSVFDPQIVLDAMTEAGATFAEFLSASQRLAQTGVSDEKAREVLRALFEPARKPASAGGAIIASAAASAARQRAATKAAAATMAADAIKAAQAAAASGAGAGDLAALLGRPMAALDTAAEVATEAAEIARLTGAPREHRNVSRVMELFKGAGRGADHAGSKGTAWGLLNSVTEFVDHEASRTQETRLTEAWFGRGADLKARALDLISAI